MAMERVTVEQNGERFTLEVPEGTTDDQIRSFLTQQQGGGITQMTQPEPQPLDNALIQGAQMAVRPGISAASTLSEGGIRDLAKVGSILYNELTPSAVGQFLSQPIESMKQFGSAYAAGHPWANTTMKQAVQSGGRALAQGALAPENLFTLPYNMAAYEQEKIRANPTAPGLEYNPYAQQIRGEFPTQGAAAAANRRRAIAGQQYGGLTAEEQDMLRKDRELSYAMRLKAAKKVLGQP